METQNSIFLVKCQSGPIKQFVCSADSWQTATGLYDSLLTAEEFNSTDEVLKTPSMVGERISDLPNFHLKRQNTVLCVEYFK